LRPARRLHGRIATVSALPAVLVSISKINDPTERAVPTYLAN
jgi:hypothetical protein